MFIIGPNSVLPTVPKPAQISDVFHNDYNDFGYKSVEPGNLFISGKHNFMDEFTKFLFENLFKILTWQSLLGMILRRCLMVDGNGRS